MQTVKSVLGNPRPFHGGEDVNTLVTYGGIPVAVILALSIFVSVLLREINTLLKGR